MAGEQTREEVAARLEAIFSSAMEGEELDKALVSIDKRLDKFEGKWGGCKPCTGCQCRCTHHPGCCAHKNFVLKNAMIFANMFKGVKPLSQRHSCSLFSDKSRRALLT